MKKKTIGVLLSIVLTAAMLSGCGSAGTPASSSTASGSAADVSKITLKDISDANTGESILSRHKNWAVKTSVSQDNDSIAVSVFKSTERYSYVEKGTIYTDINYYNTETKEYTREYFVSTESDDYFINKLLPDGKKMGIMGYIMTDAEKKETRTLLDRNPKTKNLFYYYESEKLDSITDNGDGTLTVKSNEPLTDDYEPEVLPDEWKNGKKELTYTIKKDTLEVLKIKVVVVTDSKSYDFLEHEVSFDTDMPEMLGTMLDYKKEFDNAKPDEKNKLKVVYEAGTAKEEVFEVPRYASFSTALVLREGYSTYKDPEGKQEHIGMAADNDTLYAVKKP